MLEHQPGLRERKKERTRQVIQSTAFRLFREHGYAETTVEQIAAAAEVSPSTFFRYFPTKEQLVLSKTLAPLLAAALERQPADLAPLTAYRRAVEEAFASLTETERQLEQERRRITVENPELRLILAGHVFDGTNRIAEILAGRAGRAPDDFEIRVLAGALVGAMLGVADLISGDLDAVVRGIKLLEDGLTIGRVAPARPGSGDPPKV